MSCSDETRFQGIATYGKADLQDAGSWTLAVTRPVFRGLQPIPLRLKGGEAKAIPLAVTRPVFRRLRHPGLVRPEGPDQIPGLQ